MTREQPDGTLCPFCSTAVPSYVSVCTGCGAERGTRAQSLKPGAALIRASLWANTLGAIVFLSCYMAVQPWLDESIRQGTQKVCRSEIIVKKPVAYEFLRDEKKGVYQIGKEACEDLPDLEKRNVGLLAAAVRAEPKDATITLGKTFTTRETLRGPPTWQNWLEVIARSVTALLAGALVFGLARKLWVRVFGRLSDAMWVRR
jgi:hypothetical protein